MLHYHYYRNNNDNDDDIDDTSDNSYCYLNTFYMCQAPMLKNARFLPFKPANNIVRQVLHCPILQMKTLRLDMLL